MAEKTLYERVDDLIDETSDKWIWKVPIDTCEFLTEVSKLLREIRANVGWMPMTIAPTDGRHVLLAVQSHAFVWTVEGAYIDNAWHTCMSDEPVEPLGWMAKTPMPDQMLPWKKNAS